MNKITFYDLLNKINTETPKNFFRTVTKNIENNNKMFIVTANPEILMTAKKNREMNFILSKRAEIIPDGIGIVKALKLFGKSCLRNPGIELVENLLDYANDNSLKIFVYGSEQETLDSFKKINIKLRKNICFTGMYNGYSNNDNFIKRQIIETNSDIILVALGTPRQELFINSFFDDLDKGICIGVGGSIDVLSNKVKRAPEYFLKHNLEWLYRITKEPKRIKRFFKGNVIFALVIVKEYLFKLIKKQNRDEIL